MSKETRTWIERYEAMLTDLGWTDIDVSKKTGNTLHSIKCMKLPSKEFSRGMKFAIIVYEESSENS